MKISDIYTRYKIPPHLQDHMYRVAAVGIYIINHWRSNIALDSEAITQTLLLHDMGNIIKFNFNLKLLGPEEKNVEFWKQIQQEFKDKYKNDEHIATQEIAKEIGMSEKVLQLLIPHKQQLIADGTDWNKKITSYSDCRIDPYGIVNVNTRFEDIIQRYNMKGERLDRIQNSEWPATLEIEKQLQPHVGVDLNSITNEDLQKIISELNN